jgi:hypothetical protein
MREVRVIASAIDDCFKVYEYYGDGQYDMWSFSTCAEALKFARSIGFKF